MPWLYIANRNAETDRIFPMELSKDKNKRSALQFSHFDRGHSTLSPPLVLITMSTHCVGSVRAEVKSPSRLPQVDRKHMKMTDPKRNSDSKQSGKPSTAKYIRR